MDFTTIKSAVSDQFGDTSTAMLARITRYVNFSQQDIASRRTWDFLMKNDFIRTVAPYETGTVTATESSTTITGSGTTFTSAMVGRKFRVDGDDNYYTIATYVSATEITLDDAYTETTTAGASYSIYQDVYSLASDCEKVMNIVNTSNSYKLGTSSRTGFDSYKPNPTSVGVPQNYIPAGRDSSDYMQIQLDPIPDDVYLLPYWYRKKLADLSADTDTSDIPSKYHKLLYLGALAQCYEWDSDNQANSYWAQYENMIQDMAKDYLSGSEDSISVLKSIDETGTSNKLKLPPEHFSN